MITFVGDIHGDYSFFHRLPEDQVPNDRQIIQVGDFGVTLDLGTKWRGVKRFEKPIYFIDGNHEYFPLLKNYDKPSAIAEKLVYLPRGTVLNIEGIKIGFCGGGFSIDKIARTPGYDWFPEERIGPEDLEKFKHMGKLDLLITHVPPAFFIRENPDVGSSEILKWYGFSKDFIDSNSYLVEDIWNMVGNPPLICGHMHRGKSDGKVRVLAVKEVYNYDPNSMEL